MKRVKLCKARTYIILVFTNFYLNYNILLLKYLVRNFYAFYVNLLNFCA